MSRTDISPTWNIVYASRRMGGSFANASKRRLRRYSVSDCEVSRCCGKVSAYLADESQVRLVARKVLAEIAGNRKGKT